jgi:acyl-coenzyme A thioesterase 13
MAYVLPESQPDILAHVQKFWEGRKPHSPIYQFLLEDVTFTHASKGLVRARLQLTNNHVNAHGGIHGSVSATIVDWVGGMAIAAWDNRVKTGVSVDIHVTYQSSAKDGDWIEIEGKADKVGGSLAFTSVTIWKVVDGKPGPIIANGTHTKFVKI